MNLFLKGTGLREVFSSFFPSYHCSSCCQRVKFSLSAAFVLCRFYRNFTKLKSVNSVFASNVDMIQSNLNKNKTSHDTSTCNIIVCIVIKMQWLVLISNGILLLLLLNMFSSCSSSNCKNSLMGRKKIVAGRFSQVTRKFSLYRD